MYLNLNYLHLIDTKTRPLLTPSICTLFFIGLVTGIMDFVYDVPSAKARKKRFSCADPRDLGQNLEICCGLCKQDEPAVSRTYESALGSRVVRTGAGGIDESRR